jgi:spore germination protein KB
MVLVVHPLWVAGVYVLPLLIVAAVTFFKDIFADPDKEAVPSEEVPSEEVPEGGSA